jgi:hypothetical protein
MVRGHSGCEPRGSPETHAGPRVASRTPAYWAFRVADHAPERIHRVEDAYVNCFIVEENGRLTMLIPGIGRPGDRCAVRWLASGAHRPTSRRVESVEVV